MRVSWGTDDIGGIVYLQDLPLPVVAQLYEEGFVDPDERQNASPTVREILAFVCRHPSVLVSGYMVGPERDDYRMAFCAVRLPPRYVTQSAREEFLDLCKDADELDDSVELYCWWD